MKKFLLAAGLCLTASYHLSAAEARFTHAGTPVDANGSTEQPHFTIFSDFIPSNHLFSEEWWNGEYGSGDWWGGRHILNDEGVEITASYLNNIAGNVTGGKTKGFTYTDNFSFGANLHMDKLVGWQGATITVSGLNRDGTSLSQRNIGNQFTVQQDYGGSAVMFYALYLEQKLLDDKVTVKVGRFATGDDFASTPIYWLYMNNGIDGNPQALPVNSNFSAYPWAVWAAKIRIDPTPEFNANFGAYQVSDRIFNRNYHGLDWSIRPNDGIMLISQVGWTPEFFKRPVAKGDTNDAKAVTDGKSVADGKAAKDFSPVTELKGYPGHYWFGAYWSSWTYGQFGDPDRAKGAYGFYWHADQMVYQEAPGSDQGLTLWTAFVYSPQQNIAKVPFEANAGVVYKGLIPTRDDDYTVFGIVYGNFSRNYARNQDNMGDGYPRYELVLEGNYKIQLNKFAFVQPDVQYVINPGGTGNLGNALVLGAQMGVTF